MAESQASTKQQIVPKCAARWGATCPTCRGFNDELAGLHDLVEGALMPERRVEDYRLSPSIG